MQGVVFRPFAGPPDFPAMVACANASFAADQTEIVRTLEDVTRDYASFTDCEPARDVWIAEADGEIAGYARGWHWAQADGLRLYSQLGLVAPQWCRHGIGTALQTWLEARQRQIAAGYPDAPAHAHQAFVYRWRHAGLRGLRVRGGEAQLHLPQVAGAGVRAVGAGTSGRDPHPAVVLRTDNG